MQFLLGIFVVSALALDRARVQPKAKIRVTDPVELAAELRGPKAESGTGALLDIEEILIARHKLNLLGQVPVAECEPGLRNEERVATHRPTGSGLPTC